MKITPGGQPCDICGARSAQHDSFHLTLGDTVAHIDVEMAELVTACWKFGIITTESCQGFDVNQRGETEVFLSFGEVEDYVQFAHALLLGGPRDEFVEAIEGSWDWSCHPIEWDRDISGDRITVPSMFVSVVFPLKDVAEAIERLRSGAPLTRRMTA
jgi:hypothetical protein